MQEHILSITADDNSIAASAYMKDDEYQVWLKVGAALLEIRGVTQVVDIMSVLAEILAEIAPEALEEAEDEAEEA
jgi:hypothetical protein